MLFYTYIQYITVRVSVVVNLLDHFPDVLRNSGVFPVFGAHAHTLLQHVRCLLDVFLHIAYDTIIKEDRFRAVLTQINKKNCSEHDERNVMNNRNTCSNVRIASRNANTLAPREWYMLLSAHGSKIFLASSKSLLKKQ